MSSPVALSDIAARLTALGAGPGHRRRFFKAWIGLSGWEPGPSWRYPAALARELPALRAELDALATLERRVAGRDRCARLLLRLRDGHCVESVLLPRQSVCLSTQVGCAVGCRFCATGQSGLRRQLGGAEIVAQAVTAERLRPGLRKVVLMGMGEPSHNAAQTLAAVAFFGQVWGLAHKRIVVSTIGDPRFFSALRDGPVRPALALSLHSLRAERRAWLMRIRPALPPAELLAQAIAYARDTGYPLQVEWTLLAGINDDPAEIEELAAALDPRWAMVNFIALNPVPDTGLSGVEPARAQDLITILRRRGVVSTLRSSAARDIRGGCGQLRAAFMAAGEVSSERPPPGRS